MSNVIVPQTDPVAAARAAWHATVLRIGEHILDCRRCRTSPHRCSRRMELSYEEQCDWQAMERARMAEDDA